MKKKDFRRTNYFINKQVQGIYALIIISSVGIISLIVGMEILRSFYISFGGTSTPELFFPNMNIVFVFKVMGLMVLGSLLIGGLSLFASHRIAGPIFRLNKSLKKVAKGKLDERVSFRKNDYFQEVAVNFNTMTESLEKKVNKETTIVDKMNRRVDEIVEQMNLTQLDRNEALESLDELKHMIEHLQQILIEERGY